MKTAIKFTIGALIVAAAFTLNAQNGFSDTAIDYYRQCPVLTDREFETSTLDQRALAMECASYTKGILDGMSAMQVMITTRFRTPEHFTVGQFQMIILDYICRHPQDSSSPLVFTAVNALIEAYPAKAK